MLTPEFISTLSRAYVGVTKGFKTFFSAPKISSYFPLSHLQRVIVYNQRLHLVVVWSLAEPWVHVLLCHFLLLPPKIYRMPNSLTSTYENCFKTDLPSSFQNSSALARLHPNRLHLIYRFGVADLQASNSIRYIPYKGFKMNWTRSLLSKSIKFVYPRAEMRKRTLRRCSKSGVLSSYALLRTHSVMIGSVMCALSLRRSTESTKAERYSRR